MYKTGSIILLNNKKGIFPALIRFFTKSKYTHCAITMGTLMPKCESILTAELLITVHPLQRYFDTSHYEFSIFEINGIEEKHLEIIVNDMYEKRVSRGYAVWQKLWYVYRYIAELFGFDVRKQGNWFPKNDDCSEEAYDTLIQISEFCNMTALRSKLGEWNSNCFSPNDFNIIANSFPDIFKRVVHKK